MGRERLQLASFRRILPFWLLVPHVSVGCNPRRAVCSFRSAVLFVVVNGVPSVGVQVMVGSGTIGQQTTNPNAPLPQSNITTSQPKPGSQGNASSGANTLDYDNIFWKTLGTLTAILLFSL